MGEVTQCGLCSGRALRTLLDMGMQPLAEGFGRSEVFPLKLLECQDCTMVQLSFQVDPALLFPSSHPYATGNTRALREHFYSLALAESFELRPGDLVIDIGANDGTLLDSFSSNLRKVAVEPTGQAAKCRAKGFSTYEKFFTKELASMLRDQFGPAKLVTATNVLAHCRDPHDFLEGVRELLDTGSVFVTENHDVASVIEGLQIDTIYHEHLRYYSAATITRLLAMHRLVVSEITPVRTHGGSLRVRAHKAPPHMGLRATRAANKLHRLVAQCKRRGPVYGVAAATRATPLIHYADLDLLLDCIVEVPSSEKIGKHMPGTKLLVKDESVLVKDQPPHALLFCWHWADSVIPKLREAGYEGKFIIPLPEPRITDG